MKLNQEKIKSWLKDRHNLAFFSVLVFGVLIRLYYLVLTSDQPLWWDEAEYLLMAKSFAEGSFFIDFLASRPLLLPLVLAFFMKIGLGHEVIYRIIEFVISSVALIFIYLTAKELFNKEVGIISTLLLSVFYLHLFYTSRILLDSIAPTFWIISIYFFSKGYILKKDNKKFYLSAFFGAIGVFFYNQTIALFVIYLIFMLVVEKLNLFREKRFYIFGFVSALTFLPNFILNQVLYKNPVEFITKGISVGDVLKADYWGNIKIYLSYFPTYLGLLLLIILLISIVILFYKLIIGIDLVVKKPDIESKKELFLFLWLIIPFFAIIKIVGHFEDRYLMPIFLPVFIITALGLHKIKETIAKPTNIRRVYAAIIIILIIIAFTQLKQADSIIKNKKESFIQMKQAGLWIKENSNPGDKILTSMSPILPYYSERKLISFPSTEAEFLPIIENEKPKYIVISAFTGNPAYINNITNYKMFNPVQVYQIENNLILAVLEIQYKGEQ